MNVYLQSLCEFLLTPALRWIILLLRLIVSIILYINEPQRYSYVTAIDGLSYKWHLYILAMISMVATFFTFIGMWLTIPFTDKLPEYWYLPVFVVILAIITQITISSDQIEDDGSLNPPPQYILPLKYRMVLSYLALIMDIIIFAQIFIYFGIADYSKRTILSRFILERFGGWYPGNKLDFMFDWLGVLELGYRIYIIYLQNIFSACKYGLPQSWNF